MKSILERVLVNENASKTNGNGPRRPKNRSPGFIRGDTACEAVKRKAKATVSDFDLAAILSDAFASRDGKLIAHGLRLALRVKGVEQLSSAAGLPQEEVRETLADGGSPKLNYGLRPRGIYEPGRDQAYF